MEGCKMGTTNEMSAITLLKKSVEEKMNYSLKSPTNFEALINRVYQECHELLSLSTVKRLWGYVKFCPRPRLSTLSILSRFVGFKDWDDFCDKNQICKNKNPVVLRSDSERITLLCKGDELVFTWQPDCVCCMICEDIGLYRVLYAKNCELQVGDIFYVSLFALGHPLYCSGLHRDGKILGNYVAGKTNGLSSIMVNVKRNINNVIH